MCAGGKRSRVGASEESKEKSKGQSKESKESKESEKKKTGGTTWGSFRKVVEASSSLDTTRGVPPGLTLADTLVRAQMLEDPDVAPRPQHVLSLAPMKRPAEYPDSAEESEESEEESESEEEDEDEDEGTVSESESESEPSDDPLAGHRGVILRWHHMIDPASFTAHDPPPSREDTLTLARALVTNGVVTPAVRSFTFHCNFHSIVRVGDVTDDLVCFVYTGGAGVPPGVTGRRVAGAGAGQRVRVVPAPGSRYGSRYGRWRYQPPPGGDIPWVTQRVHAGRRAEDGDGSWSRSFGRDGADSRAANKRRVDRGDGHGDLDGGVASRRQRFHVGNACASTWTVRRDDERAGRGAVRVPLRTRQDPAVLPGKGKGKSGEKHRVARRCLITRQSALES